MDEKIVNPVEEAVIPTEPVIEIPEVAEEATAKYKPSHMALVFGIIALLLAGIGGFVSLAAPASCCIGNTVLYPITYALAFIPCVGTILNYILGLLTNYGASIIAFIILAGAVLCSILSIFAYVKENKKASRLQAKATATAIVGLILGIVSLLFGGLGLLALLPYVITMFIARIGSFLFSIVTAISSAFYYVLSIFAVLFNR